MDWKQLKAKLESMIRSVVSVGIATNSDSDSGLDVTSQTTSMGKPQNVLMLSPYGLSTKHPVGSTIVKLANNGSAKSLIGYASNPENRFRDLKDWETKVGNYKTKANVYFNNDGEIVFILDNEKPSEDFMVRFNELEKGYNDLKSFVNSHIHPAGLLLDSIGNAVTGTTAKVAVGTTASISAAKITKMRAPTND